jgi:hypothetical protein
MDELCECIVEHIPGGRGEKKGHKKGQGRIQIKVVDGCDVPGNLAGS